MKALPKSTRQLLSQLLATLFSFGLFMYFCFPLLHGEMGYFALRGIAQKLAETQAKHARLLTERQQLEKRVTLLRPESLDPDLLDERARIVLGFVRPEERLLYE